MSDSDSDDIPLIQRRPPPVAPQQVAVKSLHANGSKKDANVERKRERSEPEDNNDEEENDEEESESDEEDDVPLAKRQSKSKSTPNARHSGNGASTSAAASKSAKRTRQSPAAPAPGDVKWTTLKHAGVLFPPDYVPHKIKMLYDGKPVDLTPDQEEVASLFAALKEDDPYRLKPIFLKNFWEGFKAVLGPNHVIKTFEKCDFRPMSAHFEADREAKKNAKLSKEAKAQAKKDKDEAEAKYKNVIVDGKVEQNGNFRVEPPGLFRGRGEHPLMGKVKRRIYPRDIVINISEGEPAPQHPYPGQSWMRVQNDHTVTWLAKWNDPVLENGVKYVMLSATSTFKADSDKQKYERARELKGKIVAIRKDYESGWSSTDLKEKQMAVALYFLDKLALRAGHEKEEDEAETVGCCTLKCGNLELVEPNKLKFDFLGKDSIRYENEVEVHAKVYSNVEKFKKLDQFGKKKAAEDMLFDTFDATDLNKKLKDCMPGLSAKVFRTYNASITLQTLLLEQERSENPTATLAMDERKASYDLANKEVAILCNHQRAAPRGHADAMGKFQAVVQGLHDELAELKAEMKKAGAGNKDSFMRKIAKKEEQIAKKELAARSKEDLKTVALGTSKINYMDPRITVAWCKRNELPIEKVFPKTLMGKFGWAMEVEPEFIF